MKHTIEIALGGRVREGVLEKIPLSRLKLDSMNVRFKHVDTRMDEGDIERYIWQEEDAKTLYKQIKASGGLIEPPVVVPGPDGFYLVKEGNRRIVCLRKLSKELGEGRLLKEGYDFAKGRFDTVQCIVLPSDLSQKDVDSLLGTRHVSGPKEWATLNRAWHIYEMYTRDNMDFDEIRTTLGFGKGTVIRMVKAFEKTMEYGKKHPEDKQWFRKFTYFDELLKKPELRSWTDRDPSNAEMFMDWVANGKFSDVRDVRILPSILSDPDSYKALKSTNGGLAMAREILAEKDPAVTSETFAIVKKTIATLRAIPRSEFVQTSHDSTRLKLLEELRAELTSLLTDISRIRPTE